MPPIDSSIALGIRPAQLQMPDPLERYGKSMALKNLMLQSDVAERELAENERMQALFGRGTPPTEQEVMAISPKQGMAYRKLMQDSRKTEADIGQSNAAAAKSNFDVQMQRLQHGASIWDTARDQQSYDVALRTGVVTGVFDPKVMENAPKEFNPQFIEAMKAGGLKAAEKLADQRAREGQAITVRGQDLTAGTAAAGQRVAARGQDMTQATAQRGQDMTNARALEATGAGRVPPGYRYRADGALEAIPGGPADEKEAKKLGEVNKAVDMYVAARNGLLSGLAGTMTGPGVGSIPAVTTGQQIAEGGVAAMAPVLKQLFRVSGEGVFTDRDQQLLIDMVPKRTDNAGARKEKMENIDRIVAAKLGMPIPASGVTTGRIKFLGMEP